MHRHHPPDGLSDAHAEIRNRTGGKAAAIPELEQMVRAQLENRQDANRWMEVIRRYTEITVLDESILFELVDRIEVGEARKVNGQRICDVKVVYRYVGSVDDALAQERQEAYEKLYKVGIYCRLSVDDASNSAKAKTISPLMNPSASRINMNCFPNS